MASPNLKRLKHDAVAKAIAGLTTVEEVLRVTKVETVADNEETNQQPQSQE
jgi:hypothetical protein